MPFMMVGWLGPSRRVEILRVNVGRPIVTNGDCWLVDKGV